jgi:hypothetical protein
MQILEASLYEDMAGLFNLAHRAETDAEEDRTSKVLLKHATALTRACATATYHFGRLQGTLDPIAIRLGLVVVPQSPKRRVCAHKCPFRQRVRQSSLSDFARASSQFASLPEVPSCNVGEKTRRHRWGLFCFHE